MNFTDLDFEQARARHTLFKTNLRSILYGAAINHAPVLSHQECAVGKWIYGHALADYGHIPEMRELEKVHADIHTCARELVALYESGKVDEAREGLSTMEFIADNLVTLLSAVEFKIKQEKEGVAQDPEKTSEKLNATYKEMLALHATIHALDQRIKEQNEAYTKARSLAEQNEQKFRNTVMQAPVGITILRGPDHVVEMANQNYLELVDRRMEDFVGKPLLVSLPEVEKVKPLLDNILKTGQPFYGEEFSVPLVRGGVEEITYFNFVYQPLREEDERISGIMVVASEVTGQVTAKHALQQSELQFRSLVTQSPIAMSIFKGRDFVIDLANETLLRNMWRRPLSEVEGRKLLDVFPELVDQKFPALLEKVFNSRVPHKEKEAEAIVNGPDGLRTFYLDFEYAPLLDPGGFTSGIMVTVYDVTETVQTRERLANSEQKFRLLADSMQEQVEERTHELQLMNQDLLRSNAELAQFAYVASHDLQEPLRKIQTFISRILDMENDKLSDKGRDYFQRVQQSSERMEQLIKDLLTFSRTNTTEKVLETADLNDVLHTVEEQLQELLQQQHAVIRSEVLPVMPVIRFQMEQLFTNLITNAVKFAKPDTPAQINISSAIVAGAAIPHFTAAPLSKYYHICVSDNGIGFDQQFSERIFQVFQRLHSKFIYEGTGIGLAICKKIVENHHGFIYANSEVGKGAQFHIYLPVPQG